MRPPVSKLRKQDLVWLNNNTCRHGMTYLSHYNCYLTELPDGLPEEKIGFLDIETSDLYAAYGYIFSYCIKALDGDITEYCIKPKHIRDFSFDKELVKQFAEDIKKFDRLVVYWGKNRRHDIPFLRSRSLFHKVEFPQYMEYYVTDLFDMVKQKLRLRFNRLKSACDFLDIPSKGHAIDWVVWQRAQAGDKKSLDWIMEHNREDVISTELLWKELKDFVFPSRMSI